MRSKNNFLEVLIFAFSFCLVLDSSFCWSLNDEGLALLRFKDGIVSDPYGALSSWVDEVGLENPCSWFGVGCSDGHVVVLKLEDLCLRGTVAPEVGQLIHLKSMILRNNSFTSVIPEEIANLKELEVLDLRDNNFSQQLPCHLGENLSIVLLLLDNNELLDSSSRGCKPSDADDDRLSTPEQTSSYDRLLISWKSVDTRTVTGRRLLQHAWRKPLEVAVRPRFPPRNSPSAFISPSPSPTPSPTPSPSSSPSPIRPPSPSFESLAPSPVIHTSLPMPPESSPASKTNRRYKLVAAIGGPSLILLLISGMFCYQSGKVSTVKPWATGLSGQLQRAFVTGVPKLKRSELEVACEDFSNVIGSLSTCTLYKGTLSSGVEIAVASIAMASKNDWSSSLESQFRKKIGTLSKVNHKNFINLLGYCVEENPFTRMLVFEYAPNGTLFEHLHIKEAEHLDWEARMRIAMGMAYCLDYMHRLSPPFAHRNLTASSVYLSEDCAAQISDFVFWDKGATAEHQPTPQSNVYSFGVLLSETITGKLPYSSGSDSLEDWASDYLRGVQPLRQMVDPTLTTYREDQLQEIEGVISSCIDPHPGQRPSMGQVCAQLREITRIGPEGAIPKLSPLWWAELEIISAEVS